ncbi:MAG: flagellar motor protein [Cyanobacteria bacterium J06641_5]
MNSTKALRYGEIFAFLAFALLIVMLAVRAQLRESEQVAATVPALEAEVTRLRGEAAQIPLLQQQLEAIREARLLEADARNDSVAALRARQVELEAQAAEIARLKLELTRAKAEVEAAARPPIVVLSETNRRFAFAVGSAALPGEFQQALVSEVIPQLERFSQECGCDAIEVIGHTDGLQVQGRSNLDRRLVSAFNREELPALVPGSNLDLGMLRALSIVRALKAAQRNGALPGIRYFLPYSAGQMLRLDRSLESEAGAPQNDSRRRIELRLLDSEAWTGEAGTNGRVRSE